MVKVLGDISAVLTGPGTYLTAIINIPGTADNETAAAHNKKQPRIMDLEGISTKCLPVFRTYFEKVTFARRFCPSWWMHQE